MPRALTACMLLLTLLLGGTLALRLAVYDPGPAKVDTPAPTSVHVQTGAPATVKGDFLGVIIPSTAVDIVPKFEGRLEAVEVQIGDRISAGTPLVRLDVQPLRKELAIARAALQAARAQEQIATVALTEARDHVQRYNHPRLVSLQAVPEEEMAAAGFQEKAASARLNAAQAQVQEQLARVEQIQQRISDAVLKAPFDAVVAGRYLDPGAQASPSRPVLRLLGAGGLRVRFAIPEHEVHKVFPGAPLQVRLVQRDTLLTGTVESVSPEVDAASRMIFAQARLDTLPGPEVTAGLVARVLVGSGGGAVSHTSSEIPQ